MYILMQLPEALEAAKLLGPWGIIVFFLVLTGYGFLVNQLRLKDKIIKNERQEHLKIIAQRDSDNADMLRDIVTLGKLQAKAIEKSEERISDLIRDLKK